MQNDQLECKCKSVHGVVDDDDGISNNLLGLTNPLNRNIISRFHWPCCLRCRFLRLVDCWDHSFESHWGHGCSSLVFVVCCVGSSLCDGLITRSEESYWVCVYNCVWSRNLKNEAAYSWVRLLHHRGRNQRYYQWCGQIFGAWGE
jgi:hypothetical protein